MHVAFIEEVGIPDPPERVREFMPLRVARGDFWIWDDGDRVAYVGYNDAAPEFARIAPVYTVPGARGRGYATALVAVLARELLARGKRTLFLTTDVANPTSNAIYARIGFRPQNDDCGFDFVVPDARSDGHRRMAAPRFFSPVPLARDSAGTVVELDEAPAHHATRVLRLAAGDALTLFDGTGGEFDALLERVDKRGAAVRVLRFVPVERESPLEVTLAQAIAANDAMDSAIRRATELGVDCDPAARHRAELAASLRRARGQAPRALAPRRDRSMRAVRPQSDSRCRRAAIVGRLVSRWGGSGIVLVPGASYRPRGSHVTRGRSRC